MRVEPGELLRRALDSRLRDVFTSFPAKVKTYDASKQTADLIPLVRVPVPSDDGSSIAEDLPVLPDVPILFPRAAGVAITWPITAGDGVLVMISIFSFAGWRRTGEVSDPEDQRTHHLGNAYAIPGVSPADETLAQASESALVIEASAIKIGAGATRYPAFADFVMSNLNALKSAIGGAANGDAVPAAANAVVFQDMAAAKTKVE